MLTRLVFEAANAVVAAAVTRTMPATAKAKVVFIFFPYPELFQLPSWSLFPGFGYNDSAALHSQSVPGCPEPCCRAFRCHSPTTKWRCLRIADLIANQLLARDL